MPARLRPTAAIATDAILVGDPGRALLLAQELLEQPKMSNHARGLWGYSGTTPAGSELTIQATGMGGPSATIVIGDLVELGVSRAIRIGTCTTLDSEQAKLGELLVVSIARGGGETLETPDERLYSRLREELAPPGAASAVVVSLDALVAGDGGSYPAAAVAADLQTAAVLAAGRAPQIATAAVLVVAEDLAGERLGDESLETASRRAGQACSAILSG